MDINAEELAPISLILQNIRADVQSGKIASKGHIGRMLIPDPSQRTVDLFVAVNLDDRNRLCLMIKTLLQETLSLNDADHPKYLVIDRVFLAIDTLTTCHLRITLNDSHYESIFIQLTEELRSHSNLPQSEFLEILKEKLEQLQEG